VLDVFPNAQKTVQRCHSEVRRIDTIILSDINVIQTRPFHSSTYFLSNKAVCNTTIISDLRTKTINSRAAQRWKHFAETNERARRSRCQRITSSSKSIASLWSCCRYFSNALIRPSRSQVKCRACCLCSCSSTVRTSLMRSSYWSIMVGRYWMWGERREKGRVIYR
jgi:hypothetical protein